MIKKLVQGNLRLSRGGELRERGQILIMVALAAVVMFGIVGLAVDVGRLYVTRVELGRSLDVAALSGILELNGTAQGLVNAENKAYQYFDLNEPPSARVTRVAVASPTKNELTMDATKTIDMIFLSVLGIRDASVSAHAKAGFGTQFLDAVMVLDATPSMAGNPIAEAKNAAITFKNILLGTNPQGNVKVGVTAFRGCFKPNPTPHNDCVDTNNWKRELGYNHSQLDTAINAIAGGGPSVGTNVCTGLAMGWSIISNTATNNSSQPENRQYMIILSDGDNYYPGNNTYAAPLNSPSASPRGTTVSGTDYPCQPIDSSSGTTGTPCPSPWNSLGINTTFPCYKGVSGGAISADDNMDSSGWGGGSGWIATSWTTSGTVAKVTSDAPQGTRHARLGRSSSTNLGSISRTVNLTNGTANLTYFAKRNSDFSGTDTVVVQMTCGGTFTLATHTSSNTGTSYPGTATTVSLEQCAGQNNVTIRFMATSLNSNNDLFFIDTVAITGDTRGYLNGVDGSNPTTCNEDPRPRERQLDVRTMRLARAIKQQDVEVFVVAFAGGVPGCNLDSPTVYDDENPAHCNTVLDPIAGPIGDSTHDGTANHRLLKCMASNNQGTNDHYFYASSASELTAIFTAIANQIAHRLIE